MRKQKKLNTNKKLIAIFNLADGNGNTHTLSVSELPDSTISYALDNHDETKEKLREVFLSDKALPTSMIASNTPTILSVLNFLKHSRHELVNIERPDHNQPHNWGDNSIQFPRLIAEICAAVAISDTNVDAISESMNLKRSDVHELFDRAQTQWELIKQESLHRL